MFLSVGCKMVEQGRYLKEFYSVSIIRRFHLLFGHYSCYEMSSKKRINALILHFLCLWANLNGL